MGSRIGDLADRWAALRVPLLPSRKARISESHRTLKHHCSPGSLTFQGHPRHNFEAVRGFINVQRSLECKMPAPRCLYICVCLRHFHHHSHRHRN